MSTNIEWTDETWNPVTGCSKVSQGCKHCYAERLAPKVFAGQRVPALISPEQLDRPRVFTDVVLHPDRIPLPARWVKSKRVFVNSMSDLFHEDVPFEFIDRVFAVMSVTTRHKYQVLTKRAERMQEYFEDRCSNVIMGDYPEAIAEADIGFKWTPATDRRGGYDNCGPAWPLENVWLGVSVEDQDTADERIPLLLQTPAAVRFLSCEPLLGPIDLGNLPSASGIGRHLDCLSNGGVDPGALIPSKIDWVIAGGESGPKARPSHPNWFRSLRDQCADAGVPFFFKQWGEHAPIGSLADCPNWVSDPDILFYPAAEYCFKRVGKKAAGRLLDGREHMEYPA